MNELDDNEKKKIIIKVAVCILALLIVMIIGILI